MTLAMTFCMFYAKGNRMCAKYYDARILSKKQPDDLALIKLPIELEFSDNIKYFFFLCYV